MLRLNGIQTHPRTEIYRYCKRKALAKVQFPLNEVHPKLLFYLVITVHLVKLFSRLFRFMTMTCKKSSFNVIIKIQVKTNSLLCLPSKNYKILRKIQCITTKTKVKWVISLCFCTGQYRLERRPTWKKSTSELVHRQCKAITRAWIWTWFLSAK